MTAKQQRFVQEYLIDLNATQAAIRTGYSPKTAKQQGSRLLTNADILEAVIRGKERQLESAELSATRILEEVRRLAFVNAKGFWDESGNLKSMDQLTDEQGSCLASFEVIKKNAEAGDGKIDTVHKMKIWDKVRALEMGMKHFGLLEEKFDHSGNITVKHEI